MLTTYKTCHSPDTLVRSYIDEHSNFVFRDIHLKGQLTENTIMSKEESELIEHFMELDG